MVETPICCYENAGSLQIAPEKFRDQWMIPSKFCEAPTFATHEMVDMALVDIGGSSP